MPKMKIKTKLILTFVTLKLIPISIIAYIATTSIQYLGKDFSQDSQELLLKTEKVIQETADIATNDSISALDYKSQMMLEQATVNIAKAVADFLYERDNDVLTLAQLPLNQTVLTQFFQQKTRNITVHESYHFDANKQKWVSDKPIIANPETVNEILEENKKNFHKNKLPPFNKQKISLYKEISYFDLNGQEVYKVSSIDKTLRNIADKKQTYCKAEDYFTAVQTLKQGEIYVSDVIGEYQSSKINGTYTPEAAAKAGIPFEPEKSAYAGIENPVGKPFEGILRFVTPVYQNARKVGYLTLALDHRHLSEFTDFVMPDERFVNNIADAAAGNYAFMWDYVGRCIAHARDYFIVGFNPDTGERVPPWVSPEIIADWKKSNISSLTQFLETYPVFKDQHLTRSLDKEQLQRGEIALDCRYLSKAPQCHGWFQSINDGGYGSFMINWDNVQKLTTAAAIPYYTGQYGKTKIGFGFVTVGANVDEFHKAAVQTKNKLENMLAQQNKVMQQMVEESQATAFNKVQNVAFNLLLAVIALVVFIVFAAILIANNFTYKIYKLIEGAQAFAKNQLGYRIHIEEKDEFGQLAYAFNSMSGQLQELVTQLETKVEERTEALKKANEEITELNKQLKTENIRMGAELAVTQQLQKMLTPKLVELAKIEDLDVAGFMEPCNEVGGDYYDVLTHANGLKIGVGDVTGHGLESGVVMLMLQTAIRTLVEHKEVDPVKFMSTINRTIYHNVQRMGSEKMSTLLLADYSKGLLTVYGQHEEVIIVRENGTIEIIETQELGFPLGLEENIEAFVEKHPVHLFKDDVVVFYTDGITEAENEEGEFYGTGRLATLISRLRAGTATEICQNIVDDVKAHIGTYRVFDDITLLVMKRK